MIQIILPSYDRIIEIRSLNDRHLMDCLDENERHSGFVRVRYSCEDIRKIIDEKEIVIAIQDDEVIGYYLIGKKSDNLLLQYQKEMVESLVERHKIPNCAIGFGAQAIIERQYRGMNLLSLMLEKLLELLNNKYQMLFSSVTKINANALSAHLKGGYQILDEDDTKYFVGLIINKKEGNA